MWRISARLHGLHCKLAETSIQDEATNADNGTMIESYLPDKARPLDLEVSKLRRSFSDQPVVIDGIVADFSQPTMTSRVHGGGYRVHIFSFAAWKIDSGTLQTNRLVLSRAIPNQDRFPYQLEIYSYHRVRALYSEQATRAIVLEGLPSQSCPDDLAVATETLRRPLIVEHDELGLLTFDRKLGEFRGEWTWNQCRVAFALDAQGEQPNSACLARAEQLLRMEKDLNQRLAYFLVQSVLEELPDLDSSQVAGSTFQLQSIFVSDVGTVEFWFSDGGLWGEHSLLVRLNSDEQMTFSVEG